MSRFLWFTVYIRLLHTEQQYKHNKNILKEKRKEKTVNAWEVA